MPIETPVEYARTPLTAVVHRRIKPGREREFETAMQEFIRFAINFPGYRSMTVLRPRTGERDYLVVAAFDNAAARREFKSSKDYERWMEWLGALTEGEARIHEVSGVEGWFDLPEAATLPHPKKYKMAVATFLGVFPVATILSVTIGPTMRAWPFLVSSAVFNACVVTLLTWVVMPQITRLLRRWLFSTSE